MCVCTTVEKCLNILIHVILFFIKWHVYEKKKKKSWKCQTENRKLESQNIYSFQMCNTFMKNSWNMFDRKKGHFNLTWLSVKCNVGKTAENAWNLMKWIPTFENLWLHRVKHTRRWLKDRFSRPLQHTSQLQSIFGFKAFAKNILHH